jgi:glycerophosphoryl diester phosphodiesterase
MADAVQIIAHRGASGSCPENTLAAFRRAAELGADMIELDVQLTRDAAVVVMHDWTLERTTDGAGAVADSALVDLRHFDAGAWFGPAFRGEPVPTLGEVLGAVTLPVNVELKPRGDDGLEACALAVVDTAGALERVVFSSFAPEALKRLRALTADAVLAVLWEDPAQTEALRLAERVRARALHVRKDAVTPSGVVAAHAAGLVVRAWTVNEREDFDRVSAAGVDAVFTDHPERFLHKPSRA